LRIKRKKSRKDEQTTEFAPREQRSFEVKHAHALWHLDYAGSFLMRERES